MSEDMYTEVVERIARKTYTPSDLAWLITRIDQLEQQLRVCHAERLTDAKMMHHERAEAQREASMFLDAIRSHRREVKAASILPEPATADKRLWAVLEEI